jgi:hypothetical protein
MRDYHAGVYTRWLQPQHPNEVARLRPRPEQRVRMGRVNRHWTSRNFFRGLNGQIDGQPTVKRVKSMSFRGLIEIAIKTSVSH